MTLSEFTDKYPPAAPAKPLGHPDQGRQLTAEDGVADLQAPPLSSLVERGYLSRPGMSEGKCLWVIVPSAIPAILEVAPRVRKPLAGGIAKHSNLTGNGSASCGGECWLDQSDERKLWINGGSGRYGPKSPQQLKDVESVLVGIGYEVISAGWSTDNDVPQRVFR